MKLIPSTRLGIAAASVTGVAALAVTGIGGYALAAGSLPGQVGQLAGCINTTTHAVDNAYGIPGNLKSCPKGQVPFVVQSGQPGPAGPKGDTGPSGVVSTGSHQLVTASQGVNVATGGSFSKRNTQVGTLKLDAGTYLLNVDATVTPNATTSGDVFPQLQVYDAQFTGSNWSDDVFNAGNGAVENPSATELSQGNLINGFLSGSTEITVPAGGETVYFYAFGYDSDQGEGSYTLNSETVTATELQTTGS